MNKGSLKQINFKTSNNKFRLKSMRTQVLFSLIFTITFGLIGHAQQPCVGDEANVFRFTLSSGVNYELVKEEKNWAEAAACAVERGGILAEVVDANEQQEIITHLRSEASGIDLMANPTRSVAPDGGGAVYVWIGGNDMGAEGDWVWDGKNSGNGVPFWTGDVTGSAVGSSFNHWGNGPSNLDDVQDALAMGVTDWRPNISGAVGDWNDLNEQNALYYLIEYAPSLSIDDVTVDHGLRIYPNPSSDFIALSSEHIDSVTIFDLTGKKVQQVLKYESNSHIDISNLHKGVYLVELISERGNSAVKKMVKE